MCVCVCVCVCVCGCGCGGGRAGGRVVSLEVRACSSWSGGSAEPRLRV